MLSFARQGNYISLDLNQSMYVVLSLMPNKPVPGTVACTCNTPGPWSTPKTPQTFVLTFVLGFGQLGIHQGHEHFTTCYLLSRMNATASQVPIMGGAYQGEDRGYTSSTDIPLNDPTPWNTYNQWLSPVQGTLPPEWAEVFPNIEIM